MTRFTFDGVEVHLSRPGGGVIWCNDWRRIDELVTLGYLTRKHYGPATYGHCDYFVV